jgi:hypothetical protein
MRVTNAQGADFDFIALIKRTGILIWPEAESYMNSNLSINSPAIVTFIDTDFTGGNAVLFIDPTQMSLDTEYCVRAIAKPKIVSGTVCAPITIDFTLTIANIIPIFGGNLSIYYTIAWNLTAGAGTIDDISITSPIGGLTFSGTGNSGSMGTFQATWPASVPLNLPMSIVIETVGGCMYSSNNINVPGSNVIGPLNKLVGASGMTTVIFNV